MADLITQGYGGDYIVTQGLGYAAAPAPVAVQGSPVTMGLGGSFLVTQGYGDAGGLPAVQPFRAALYAKLSGIAALTAIVGESIYPGSLPETHDFDRDGPALTYTVVSLPRNHHLGGSDGTATARVQFSAWSHQESASDAIALALFNAIDGVYNDSSWGNGTLVVMSCLQADEVDLPSPPREGSDDWIYQIASDYEVKHRVAIPTHS